MIELTHNSGGSDVINAINDNLGSLGYTERVGDGISASAVSDVLNGVFGNFDGCTSLTELMSGSEFAEAVNGNFAIAEQGAEYAGLKILHVSDTHGETSMFDKIIADLGQDTDIDIVAITGDMTKYVQNNYTDATKSAINSIKATGKLMMCPGNHDTYDNTHSGYGNNKADQVSETAWLKACLGNTVNFDVSNAVGGYWYRDVEKDGNIVRFISLDQYETGSTVYSGNNRYATIYSQAQVDWILELLYYTPSAYSIIILMHEPPIQYPDSAAVGMAGDNLFVSDILSTWGARNTGLGNDNLIPQIMRAYMHSENLSIYYQNYDNRGGHGTLIVQKDFRGVTPATFLCYLGGHMHEDICDYIPNANWSDQLMLFVTAGDSRVQYSSQDDLLWNYDWNTYYGEQFAAQEPKYRINELVFDFAKHRIKVTRIGNKTTADKNRTNGSARPLGTRVREVITFPFVKRL